MSDNLAQAKAHFAASDGKPAEIATALLIAAQYLATLALIEEQQRANTLAEEQLRLLRESNS